MNSFWWVNRKTIYNLEKNKVSKILMHFPLGRYKNLIRKLTDETLGGKWNKIKNIKKTNKQNGFTYISLEMFFFFNFFSDV